jgi:uncharacterized protein YkwD
MSIRTTLAVAAVGAAFALTGSPAPQDAAASGSVSVSPAHRLVEAVNRARRQRGLPALRASRDLHRSARRFAASVRRRGVLAHGPAIAAPARFRVRGENLALTHGLHVQLVVRLWLRSPGHRAVMLSPRMRWAGAGASSGRFRGAPATVWVLHVGRIR